MKLNFAISDLDFRLSFWYQIGITLADFMAMQALAENYDGWGAHWVAALGNFPISILSAAAVSALIDIGAVPLSLWTPVWYGTSFITGLLFWWFILKTIRKRWGR